MTRRYPDGPLGPSQTERVHVRRGRDAGSLEPFDLVRVVDADGDPEFAERALAGTLMRLPDGTDLAEPYVFHARESSLLVLVVPGPARHRELGARRELLDALDALESVPAYAFDFRVVIDAIGLRAALAIQRASIGPPPLIENVYDDELDELPLGPELSDEDLSHLATDLVDDAEAMALEEVQELDADAAVQELGESEDAGDLGEDTHRTAERGLREWSEDTHWTDGPHGVNEPMGDPADTQATAATRGTQHTQRTEDTHLGVGAPEDTHRGVGAPEDTHRGVGAPEDTHRGVGAPEDSHDTMDAAFEPTTVDGPRSLEDDVGLVDDRDVTEEDPGQDEANTDIGWVSSAHFGTTAPSSSLPSVELVDDIQDVEDAELADAIPPPDAPIQSFLDEGPEYAVVDADWVTLQEGEEDEPLTLDDSDLVVVPDSYSILSELPAALPTNVNVPRDFAVDSRRLRAGLFAGRVWLFAKSRSGVFEGTGIDAAVQFASVGGRSIVLVALADLSADRGEAVRLAADLASPAPRALLSSLACDFVLSVAVFHEGPAPVRCFELRSPREDNVARLLARPTTPGPDAVEVATAIARAMAAPPPLDALEHPFQPRRAASSPTDLRAEIRNVARWLEPSRRDRVRLGLGVPEPAVQEVCEAVVRDALRVGIALPPMLMQWGVSAGLAMTPADIVAQQLVAFLTLTSGPERGGLRDAEVAANWNALRGAAAAFSVPIPVDVEAVLRAMDADDIAADSGALETLNVAALIELTRHAAHRRAAAAELLRRDAELHAEVVGAALRDMRRDEVIALVPALKRAGEAVVSMLLDTLGAKKTFVRQAAALTLSSLQAEEAIGGLLHLACTETTSLWEEFARALAAFGDVALESIIAAIETGDLTPDRAALVLAYLAKGGYASVVEDLVSHSHRVVADVAGSIPARLPTVERHLREFYDASATPTGPREFGKKVFRALHPETAG
ncbi:MAG: hypothetical protein H6726_01405 [Sandaracinaceae bacterium]|nr:hypothetical protein [Sandaracinaceae bacterium]